MNTVIAIFLFFIFLFLSGIHFYWGFGGKWGNGAVFPTKPGVENPVHPGKTPTFIVAVALLAMGIFYLIKTQILLFELPNWLSLYGLWVLSGIFIIRALGDGTYVGFFKKYKQTTFGKNDTFYYSPLCLAIGLLSLYLALTIGG